VLFKTRGGQGEMRKLTRLTPLQIEKKSAKDADFRMMQPEGIHSALNRVFAIGCFMAILFLLALGCLIGRQADKQWAEIPYVVESPPLPSQMVEWDDLDVERRDRAQFVLDQMDQLWSTPLTTQHE